MRHTIVFSRTVSTTFAKSATRAERARKRLTVQLRAGAKKIETFLLSTIFGAIVFLLNLAVLISVASAHHKVLTVFSAVSVISITHGLWCNGYSRGMQRVKEIYAKS